MKLPKEKKFQIEIMENINLSSIARNYKIEAYGNFNSNITITA